MKTLMVCLDMTEMDNMLIRYAAYFFRSLKEVEKVYFVHNIKFDFPETAGNLLKELDKPLGELLSEVILEKVAVYFDTEKDRDTFRVIVEQDSSTSHILARTAKTNKVDLILVGNKISYKGSGRMTETLLGLNSFKSAVLMVPETAYHQIRHILVPTDFSKASRKAVELGAYIREQFDADLQCQHVFSIPAHYFPFIPVDNMEEGLRKEAKKQWQSFAKSLHEFGASGIDCALTFGRGKSTAETIYDFALQEQKDLVIINTKGMGAITSFLIGSVAIRLIRLDMHIPLLVTK